MHCCDSVQSVFLHLSINKHNKQYRSIRLIVGLSDRISFYNISLSHHARRNISQLEQVCVYQYQV